MKSLRRIEGIAIITVLVVALILTGCPEGVDMVDDVIVGEPPMTEGPGETSPEPAITMGEVKQPDPAVETVVSDVGMEESPVVQVPEPTPMLTPEPEYGVTNRYYGEHIMSEVLPPTAWVIGFPGTVKMHAPPRGNSEDFIGQVVMPYGVDPPEFTNIRGVAPVSDAIVTITHGERAGEQTLTNEDGYYLFENVESDELYLRVERQWLEPKEVIVYRDRASEPQEIPPNRVYDTEYQERRALGRIRLGNEPGSVLMGIRFPDAMRHILDNELLPHEITLILTDHTNVEFQRRAVNAIYLRESRVIALFNHLEDDLHKGDLNYDVIAHELAHARQQAIALQHGSTNLHDWKDTLEGQAYQVALEKDLEGVQRGSFNVYYIDRSHQYQVSVVENNAEFCNLYWDTVVLGHDDLRYGGILVGIDPVEGLRKAAPHRFEWCQIYLNSHTKYEYTKYE